MLYLSFHCIGMFAQYFAKHVSSILSLGLNSNILAVLNFEINLRMSFRLASTI